MDRYNAPIVRSLYIHFVPDTRKKLLVSISVSKRPIELDKIGVVSYSGGDVCSNPHPYVYIAWFCNLMFSVHRSTYISRFYNTFPQ